MNKVISNLILFSLLVIAPLQASNNALFVSSLRQMAMGGVGVTVSDRDSALYNNPAGLADVKNFHLKTPRFLLGISEQFVDSRDVFQDLMDSSDENEQINMLKTLIPFKGAIEISSTPIVSIVTQNFGVGVFGSGSLFTRVYRKTSPKLLFSGFADVYPSIGYGSYVKLGDQEIAVGASIKGILRTSFYNEETGAEFYTEDAESILEKFNSGEKISAGIPTYTANGIGLDLGMLGEFDLEGFDGQYGVSLKNIGANLSGTKILKVNGSSVEESTTFEIPIVGTFGFGGETYLPLLLDVTLACDIDFISPEQSVFKRLHFGLEKKLHSVFNLRAGINQGNIVGGFGIDLFGYFHLDYAYNVREFGDEIGQDRVTYHVLEIGLI